MGQVGSRIFTFSSQATNIRYSLHPSTCHGLTSDIEKMRKILQQDADSLERLQFSSEDAYLEMFPLHIAAYMSHTNCTQFLLDCGAQVNSLIPTKFGKYSALEFAIMSGINSINRFKIVEILLKNGAYSNNTWNDHYNITNMLETVINEGCNDIVKLLLENESKTEDLKINDIYWRSSDFYTPFITSVVNWNVEALKMLLLHGAKMFFRVNMNYSRGPFSMLSIPHYIIHETDRILSLTTSEIVRDQVLSRSIKVLEIYREFGGNLWIKQSDEKDGDFGEESVLDYLKRHTEVAAKLGAMSDELIKMTRNPLALKNVCRNAIRKEMGRDYWKNVELLHLPQELKEFLRFIDIVINGV